MKPADLLRQTHVEFHLAIRFVCLYLFSACAPLNYTGQETPALSASQTAAQDPASTPSLQASIAPSPSIETPSQTNSYESSSYGFSFKTPDDFRLEEQPALPGIKLWLGLSDPRDPGAPNQYEPALGLIVYENPEQRPLVDWFTAHWGDPPEMGQRPTQPVVFFSPQIENQNMVQGRPALQYESGAWPIRYETSRGWFARPAGRGVQRHAVFHLPLAQFAVYRLPASRTAHIQRARAAPGLF